MGQETEEPENLPKKVSEKARKTSKEKNRTAAAKDRVKAEFISERFFWRNSARMAVKKKLAKYVPKGAWCSASKNKPNARAKEILFPSGTFQNHKIATASVKGNGTFQRWNPAVSSTKKAVAKRSTAKIFFIMEDETL